MAKMGQQNQLTAGMGMRDSPNLAGLVDPAGKRPKLDSHHGIFEYIRRLEHSDEDTELSHLAYVLDHLLMWPPPGPPRTPRHQLHELVNAVNEGMAVLLLPDDASNDAPSLQVLISRI